MNEKPGNSPTVFGDFPSAFPSLSWRQQNRLYRPRFPGQIACRYCCLE